LDKAGVSVIIATLNRGDYLYDCLSDLIAQDHRPLEILVVDQSTQPNDAVETLVAQHPDIITYHRVSFRGLTIARNYGLKHARYKALVYLDDDIRCPPDLVSHHLSALQLPNVGMVAGRVDEKGGFKPNANRAGMFHYWTATPERFFAQDGAYDTDGVAGTNFSVWKAVAEQVGGFDEALSVGAALYEETEFSLRVKQAGYRIYFNSQARLDHLASPTGGCRVDQVYDYMWSLAHNRTFLIRRYLKWYQYPTAFLELFRLGTAYAYHYKQPRALLATVNGIRSAKPL
jgi:GT2 family glycosyltransferase